MIKILLKYYYIAARTIFQMHYFESLKCKQRTAVECLTKRKPKTMIQ